MRVALAVTKVSAERETNLQTILSYIARASGEGAHLVLFSEAALTGLISNGDPARDLQLGEQIPGPSTLRICEAAKTHSIYVGMGLLEREGGSLFDSFVLIDPRGTIELKYRRISRGWRGERWDKSIYREGDSVCRIVTPHGPLSVLICGDLFDDRLCQAVRDLDVAYLLYPMARNFDDNSYDQARWDCEEKLEYISRGNLTGATLLMVNQLGGEFGFDTGDAFGGALVAARDGVFAELPLGKEGMLLVDLPVSHAAKPHRAHS